MRFVFILQMTRNELAKLFSSPKIYLYLKGGRHSLVVRVSVDGSILTPP